MSRNFISTNQELHKGDFLVSNNGEYKAVFQEDGNLVVYKWSPVWESGTAGKNPHRLILQADTNLVMYTKRNKPIWATNNVNYDCFRGRLTINDDGKLTVESDGKVIWCNGKRLTRNPFWNPPE